MSAARGSVLARAAVISLAASRSSRNFGSGSGFLGISPAMTGLRAGAPGQSHSMLRSKNWRTVRIRCRCVSRLITWPADRCRPASHTLQSSMSSRRISAMAVICASVTSQRANWRSAPSAAATLPGAKNVPS